MGPVRDARRARLERIAAEVAAGRGGVESLCAVLGVSVATVRRDLGALAAEGRVTRTYGGAVTAGHATERRLREKEIANRPYKRAIAAHAAALIRTGDLLIIDAGTTTGALAELLVAARGLTVLTNGVNTLGLLAESDGIELIVLGGRLRHTSQAVTGPAAEAEVRRVVADKVFLGADGLSPHGISCPTLEQASLKSAMAAQGREVFVLADHGKLGGEPFPYVAPVGRGYTVITDADADDAVVGVLTADGRVRVVRAGEAP
ncbi:MAG TPA: DeoR/GlpR family DNA-binding transcription regulator [Streptosporangiaceae bacterium]